MARFGQSAAFDEGDLVEEPFEGLPLAVVEELEEALRVDWSFVTIEGIDGRKVLLFEDGSWVEAWD